MTRPILVVAVLLAASASAQEPAPETPSPAAVERAAPTETLKATGKPAATGNQAARIAAQRPPANGKAPFVFEAGDYPIRDVVARCSRAD